MTKENEKIKELKEELEIVNSRLHGALDEIRELNQKKKCKRCDGKGVIEISNARDDYYKLKTDVFMCSHEGLIPAVENYVSELEQEKAELLDVVNILKKIFS